MCVCILTHLVKNTFRAKDLARLSQSVKIYKLKARNRVIDMCILGTELVIHLKNRTVSESESKLTLSEP